MSDWYYAVNNEQKGPISETELKGQLAASRIPADSLVWTDGMANWTPASEVSALAVRPGGFGAGGDTLSGVTISGGAVPAPGTTRGSNPESITPLSVSGLMTGGEALEVDAEDAENNKIQGILAYLFILWLVPLVSAKDSPFAKYHANQGLVLFIVEVVLIIVLQIVNAILSMIMLYQISFILSSAVALVIVGLAIYGIINAAAGKCVPLPVIGKFKLIK
jgi:uncharacterized membrane protein